MNTPKDKTERLFIRLACTAMLVFMLLCTTSCGSANSNTDTEVIPSLYEVASKSTTASYKPETAEPQVSEVMQTYTSDRVVSILKSTEGLSEISSFTDTQGNNPDGLHSVIYFKS